MGLFFDSAHDRAKKTYASATRAKRALQAASHELSEMEHVLGKLEHELPPNLPSNALKGLQTSMSYTERHAEQTLHHLRKLRQHVNQVEQHFRR